MLFALERVYLTDEQGKSAVIRDLMPYRREATSPRAVIVEFVAADGARILGTITEHAGGAAAIAWKDGRLYSIMVEPAGD